MQATFDELVKAGISEQGARDILETLGFEVKNKEKKTVVPVEVYSRVVGYFRPVQQWNNGKREEFYQRKTFILNSRILNRGGSHETTCSDR